MKEQYQNGPENNVKDALERRNKLMEKIGFAFDMYVPSKNLIFCPEDVEVIANEISRCGKIAMMKLEDNLREIV